MKFACSALLLVFCFQAPAATTLRIMQYNVDNLFDTSHDAGKDDWEFLPASAPGRNEACRAKNLPRAVAQCLKIDWTPEKLSMKVRHIAQVVSSAPGGIPDVLSLVEIENDTVIRMVAQALGYDQVYITHGPDARGVNVALLVRQSASLRAVGVAAHAVTPDAGHPNRDILEGLLTLNGQPLSVFVNHWPSQGAPVAARIKAAQFLMAAIADRLRQTPEASILAAGDFNVIDGDQPNPLSTVLANPANANHLVDIDPLFRSQTTLVAGSTLPPGTFYFAPKAQWNVLDHFFVSAGMLNDSGLHIELPSYQIITHPWMMLNGAFPFAYNFDARDEAAAGYSDHFPIFLQISTP